MKKFVYLLAAVLVGCMPKVSPPAVIFDTDLGNDVDDAIALVMLHRYADEGKVQILAEGLSKDGMAPAMCMDIFNKWYGHPSIPIGIIANGPDCETDAVNYARAVAEMAAPDGDLLFPGTGLDYAALPEAHLLYRDILKQQPDHSVIFVTVGFSTNLARLLETDRDLVACKTKLLVLMAGNFQEGGGAEYNVRKDIASAQAVAALWPGEIVYSPYELGVQVNYPATVIEERFPDVEPLPEAYKAYLPMPYDRPCWDPTALIYAVEGEDGFTVSNPGTIGVSEEGITTFAPSPEGLHRYLSVTPEQAKALVERIVKMTTKD